MQMKQYQFWLVAGTQTLYGEQVIRQVARDAQELADSLNGDSLIPGSVLFKGAMLDSDSIEDFILQANADRGCAGVITWMHTFSPSKMWIHGLSRLQKPYLHFNTQHFRDIPWDSIDMDYMNLHQSAHGDREHGFIGARLRLPRKVLAGHKSDENVRRRMGIWMRAAIGVSESRKLKVCRFGDNMRDVAVTEGDKVEAEIKLGWGVNGWGIGDLIQMIDAVTEDETDEKMREYEQNYTMETEDIDAVRYQAKMEVGLSRFLRQGGFGAFTDTFQDLQELRQLPGIAVQNLMKNGYGFGGEGDWKVAALVRVMKLMARGLPGGTAFMEDYSYHMDPDNEGILGAHMLEVDPDIAADKPRIVVHPLGIGGREDPARLIFATGEGDAICVSLVDMGGRMRMIVNDVKACGPFQNMPKLPVAQVMWKPLPDLSTSAEAWIQAGGAHHTVLSYQLTAEHMRDFCDILGIEFVHINAKTRVPELMKELALNDMMWKLRGV